MGHGVHHNDALVAGQEHPLTPRYHQTGWTRLEDFRGTMVPQTDSSYCNTLRKIPQQYPLGCDSCPTPTRGQWLAPKEEDGSISKVLHVTSTDPLQATLYQKDKTKRLLEVEQQNSPHGNQLHEVRVVQCGGPIRAVLDINPRDSPDKEHTLWLWGND